MRNKKILKLMLFIMIVVGGINLLLLSGFTIKFSYPIRQAHKMSLIPTAKALECTFQEASCSWDPAVGATNYSVTVTEVDSGAVIKNEQVPATTTKITFPVIQGKTYKCDVSAVNSCGAVGPAGTFQLLCQIQGFSSPSPTPIAPPPVVPPPVVPPPTGGPVPPPPVVTPKPTTVPLPTSAPIVTPTPAPLACGFAPCNEVTAPCQTGLVCLTSNNGTRICANPNYQTACKTTPNGGTCCTAPVGTPIAQPPQNLPSAGTQELTFAIGIFSSTLVVLGILGLFLL